MQSIQWTEMVRPQPWAEPRSVHHMRRPRVARSLADEHPVSFTGAYRWCARWRKGSARLITWLCPLAAPPEKTDGLPDPLHLRHLHAAFPDSGCPAAAFQNRFQIPLVS